jgi:hypothetical protein
VFLQKRDLRQFRPSKADQKASKSDQKPAKTSKKEQKTASFRLTQLDISGRHPRWR